MFNYSHFGFGFTDGKKIFTFRKVASIKGDPIGPPDTSTPQPQKLFERIEPTSISINVNTARSGINTMYGEGVGNFRISSLQTFETISRGSANSTKSFEGSEVFDHAIHGLGNTLFIRRRGARTRGVDGAKLPIKTPPIVTFNISTHGRREPIKNRFGKTLNLLFSKLFLFKMLDNFRTIPQGVFSVNNSSTTMCAQTIRKLDLFFLSFIPEGASNNVRTNTFLIVPKSVDNLFENRVVNFL